MSHINPIVWAIMKIVTKARTHLRFVVRARTHHQNMSRANIKPMILKMKLTLLG